MQRYIEGLSKGNFSYELPRITFDDREFEISVERDKVYRGSFKLEVNDGRRAEGFVYSSDHRMNVVTREFDGNSVEIKYEFNSFGMEPGSTRSGRFIVVSTGGELEIPVNIRIVPDEEDSGSSAMDIEGFVKLASEDWYGAYEIFSSDRFLKTINDMTPYLASCYRSLTSEGMSMQCMEEFLTGIGGKDPIEFELSENGEIFQNVTESFKHVFKIRKSDWGYIRLVISSDCEFLTIQKNVMDTEDFVGNSCDIQFNVNFNKLHQGINYGRIQVSSPMKTKEYLFRVIVGEVSVRSVKELEMRHNISECIEKYSEHILGHISLREWGDAFLDKLTLMSEEYPDNSGFTLAKAMAMSVMDRPEAARIITEDFRRSHKPEDNEDMWALCLYIMVILENDDLAIDGLKNEFAEYYKRNRDSLYYSLVSPYMEMVPISVTEHYMRIKHCFECGYDSPLLYARAATLLNHNPLLLSNPDDTDIFILQWMERKGCIGESVGHIFLEQLPLFRKFSRRIYRIADYICSQYDTPENIGLMCGYLIRVDVHDPEFNRYYLRGIEYDLKVTKLYEYYIDSIDEEYSMELPKVVYMYFKYNSNIDNRKKAYLFANLITNRKLYPDIYENYRDDMIEFAGDQFLKGVINDNMAIIYREFFVGRMMSENTCDQFTDILSAFRLETENTRASSVTVVYNKLNMEHTYAITGGKAVINLYSTDYEMVFSDGKIRFISGVDYSITPMVDFEKYLRVALKMYKRSERLIVRYMENKKDFDLSENDELEMRYALLFSDNVRDNYKAVVKSEIINFYHDSDSDYLSEGLLDITLKDLSSDMRVQISDVLIDRGYYEQAYKLIRSFGYDDISSQCLLKLATYIIEKYNYEPSVFMDDLCMDIYERGIYNEQSIKYLKREHKGSLADLDSIRRACESFGIDTYSLTEQIIRQSLYTGKFLPDMEEIYDSYYRTGATGTVNKAYLQYNAYDYLIKKETVYDRVFDYIQRELKSGEQLSDVCALALIKKRSEEGIREDFRELAEKFLREFFMRGYFFSSFEKLDKLYSIGVIPEGRAVIEHITDPEKKVVIHYKYGTDEYEEQEMENAFEGIFVKEFTMFFGDEIEYYISEETADRAGSGSVVEKGRYRRNEAPAQEPVGCFEMINGILYALDQKEDKRAAGLMKDYNDRKLVAEKLFTPL
ncbi:MAG: hypothetical protein IK152_05795 [Lachnospiraceae bacterium]|nr:hypothetical protein [Lachnospiraceae bacterium]